MRVLQMSDAMFGRRPRSPFPLALGRNTTGATAVRSTSRRFTGNPAVHGSSKDPTIAAFHLQHRPLGDTGARIPPLVFGTSCLGNLYRALPFETKRDILRELVAHVPAPVALDTAVKYGAGLALTVLGRILRDLRVPPRQLVLSNKLGWKRVPLRAAEPGFEPGVWADLEHDAELRISYRGILECWQQGCELLGEPYRPTLVAVHDPDEYLQAAVSADDRQRRKADILGAYRALHELRAAGEVLGVGVGAKDWRVIRELDGSIRFDWVMLANSLTIFSHPPELLEFVASLHARGIGIINSAVLHGGFLVGGDYFDYRRVSGETARERRLLAWRQKFAALCRKHGVPPLAACMQFALSVPGVSALAVATSSPVRIKDMFAMAERGVPPAFWQEAKNERLIAPSYRHVG